MISSNKLEHFFVQSTEQHGRGRKSAGKDCLRERYDFHLLWVPKDSLARGGKTLRDVSGSAGNWGRKAFCTQGIN